MQQISRKAEIRAPFFQLDQQKIILLKVGKTELRRGTATAKKIQYVETFQKQD